MRPGLRIVALILILVNSLAVPVQRALAANLDTTADRVIGQPDFTSNDSNHGGISASSLSELSGLALDRFGNLYVADTDNNRVLEYDAFLVRVFAPLITR